MYLDNNLITKVAQLFDNNPYYRPNCKYNLDLMPLSFEIFPQQFKDLITQWFA